MKARKIWAEMREQIYMIKIRAWGINCRCRMSDETAQLMKQIEALEKNIELFCEIPQDEQEVCQKIAMEYMRGNHNTARQTLRMYSQKVAGEAIPPQPEHRFIYIK